VKKFIFNKKILLKKSENFTISTHYIAEYFSARQFFLKSLQHVHFSCSLPSLPFKVFIHVSTFGEAMASKELIGNRLFL